MGNKIALWLSSRRLQGLYIDVHEQGFGSAGTAQFARIVDKKGSPLCMNWVAVL